jgi:hypothetical protein
MSTLLKYRQLAAVVSEAIAAFNGETELDNNWYLRAREEAQMLVNLLYRTRDPAECQGYPPEQIRQFEHEVTWAWKLRAALRDVMRHKP